MDQQQPSAASTATAPRDPDRKGQVILGGLLAGLGLSLAVAFLMHVVQEFSPNGYGISIKGSVIAVVLLAGPLFGLGLALAITPLIPDSPPDASPAKPTVDPADG
jgi:hypothetical protein